MDKVRFVIETHLRTGRPIKDLAQNHDVSPSWLFTLLRRYRLEGPEGLEPRSRRPKRSPGRIAGLFEDEIVALRKELLDAGFDAGAETIAVHLGARHDTVPSVSTIWRVLKARGFVTPQPHKRPQSSLRRFEADLPNECWQADMTHVRLEDGAVFEVLNIVDDHSRLCIASRAMVHVKAPDVIRVLHKAAETWGYPASFLSDNGLIFSTQSRYGLAGATEQELFSLGIRAKHSRPYHPQTCGKVERFHQTLKKFLGRQRTSRQEATPASRSTVSWTTTTTSDPTAASGGPRPPWSMWPERRPDRRQNRSIEAAVASCRHDKLDGKGTVTLRVNGQMHHIPGGRQFAGLRVRVFVGSSDPGGSRP